MVRPLHPTIQQTHPHSHILGQLESANENSPAIPPRMCTQILSSHSTIQMDFTIFCDTFAIGKEEDPELGLDKYRSFWPMFKNILVSNILA